MSTLRVSAKLDRTDGSTPWGFRMAGGKDFGSPLIIQRVTPGSLSARCGLQVGDTISSIGGIDALSLSHKEAQDMILGAGNSLELKLEREAQASYGNDYHQQHQQPAQLPEQLPWQHQQVNKPTGPPPMTFAPKPFQKPGAITSITSHTANLSLGGSSSSHQDESLPWLRKPAGQPSSYGSPSRNFDGVSAPASRGAQSAGGVWRPQVPTGERKMKVGRPGMAQRKAAIVEASRVPICTACHTSIRGPFISALDKTWCPDHFICANPNCAQPLINCGFVEEMDQLYCEHDYEKYLAPRCAKCSAPIVGEVVNAMKNTYHMDCFVCMACHQPIGTGSFHNEDGKIYCAKDWGALFQTKCYGCQFPIEPGDRWVEALSQNWHSECFNCSTCQINLEGQSFCAKNGKPYCKKHGGARRI